MKMLNRKITRRQFAAFVGAAVLVSGCDDDKYKFDSKKDRLPGSRLSELPQPSKEEKSSPASKPKRKSRRQKKKEEAAQASANYNSVLSKLREKQYGDLADILKSRVEQKSRKMKLTEAEAAKTGEYIVANLPTMPRSLELKKTLPKTTIELIRAVGERGVSKEDAEGIADYLIKFMDAMKIQNLKSFDESNSHVVGREWEDIDYRGEGMNAASQKRQWAPLGVTNYKKAEYFHNYFKYAKDLPYFGRVYQPQGSMNNLDVPWDKKEEPKQ